MTQLPVGFGIDHLLAQHLPALQGLRIGLVTNDVATTARFPHPLLPTRLALQQAGLKLTKLFAPEHGLGASAADGAEIANARDVLTGLPIFSLYGATFRPTPEMLADLDLLLFDIPDIGARFYTYIWTLSYLLEVCPTVGLPLWVLDRPNPAGGDLALAEGPMLDEERISTFIGRWSIPIRHGLTAGELAQLWNHERALQVDLTVIPAPHWRRDLDWPTLNLPFVPTSPAMPSDETIFPYFGTCLFEGTNLSEGRGTATPFRVVGAPWLAANAIVAQFNALQLPGVVARSAQFIPASSKYANQLCEGIMFHVTDRRRFRSVAAGLHLLRLVIAAHRDEFAWLPYPTAANAPGYGHFDRLIGNVTVRTQIEQLDAADAVPVIHAWTAVPTWAQRVEPFLLYA
ncbi:MAG: DUF1343 domain-containing protein [Caldilineaceae bacterium]|nr:DUF1343 domain-containing protein [Caldilineaceae bacterium]